MCKPAEPASHCGALTFRLATWGEEGAIVDFVNAHFDMQLPLVNDPAFFKHYYCGERLQFALAEQDGALVAVAGYILANESDTPDLWVSVWVAIAGAMGAGLELMNALPRLTGARVVACNNIRENTCAFYRFLGWTAERLPHYYRLSKAARAGDCKLFCPAQPCHTTQQTNTAQPCAGDQWSPAPHAETHGVAQGDALPLQPVPDAATLAALGLPRRTGGAAQTPAKDVAYLQRRYFAYPYQTYDVWCVQENGVLLAYCVTRTVQAFFAETPDQTIPVLRVVDFIGDASVLPRIGTALDAMMEAQGAEYTDCYCAGIPAETFAAAGFTERKAALSKKGKKGKHAKANADNTPHTQAQTDTPSKGSDAQGIGERTQSEGGDAGITCPTETASEAIVPNYLTSVLQQNTEYFYFTNQPEGFTMFKADGDQDRPPAPVSAE